MGLRRWEQDGGGEGGQHNGQKKEKKLTDTEFSARPEVMQ